MPRNDINEFDARIQDLARRNGVERSLYMGESIGNMLLIAWGAFDSVGNLFRRKPTQKAPA